MVSLVVAVANSWCITMHELFYWKMCLVSEETAVLTPNWVILITVTAILGVCTRVVHPACALTTAKWCSTPVRHLSRITWHPPSITASEYHWTMTLVLDKLLAMWGGADETRQLRQTRSCVVNVTCVASLLSITAAVTNPCSALTVVTDNSNTNTILVSHVTVHRKWCQTTHAIWINDVISAFCCRGEFLYRTAWNSTWKENGIL